MLKIISCKNEGEVYALARRDPFFAKATKDKKEKFILNECSFDEAIALSENLSIFGDKNAYILKTKIGNRGVVNEDDLGYLNKSFFESLETSVHLFVLTGYGAEFEKTCEATSFKVLKIKEAVVNDFPAELVTALQKGDKKNSWDLLLKELDKKDAEPIHGSCVFAYKSLLVYLNDTSKNSPNSGVKDFSWQQAKRNAVSGKRSKGEVVDKYFKLVLAYHKARNGELDLGKQLEKWVLEN